MLRLLPCLSASLLPLIVLPCCRAAVRARRPAASLLRYISNARRRPRPCRPSCRPACCCRLPRLPPSCSPPLLLASSFIRHKYGRIRGAPIMQEPRPNRRGGPPLYLNTFLRCLLAKFFILFFLFWDTESNP